MVCHRNDALVWILRQLSLKPSVLLGPLLAGEVGTVVVGIEGDNHPVLVQFKGVVPRIGILCPYGVVALGSTLYILVVPRNRLRDIKKVSPDEGEVLPEVLDSMAVVLDIAKKEEMVWILLADDVGHPVVLTEVLTALALRLATGDVPNSGDGDWLYGLGRGGTLLTRATTGRQKQCSYSNYFLHDSSFHLSRDTTTIPASARNCATSPH